MAKMSLISGIYSSPRDKEIQYQKTCKCLYLQVFLCFVVGLKVAEFVSI
jgi:hypothetical protein